MVIALHDDPEKTRPNGLARYANDFLKAAVGADQTFGMEPGYEIFAPIPVLYLIGHSMELSLKAYLLYRGVTLRELRRHYGHNLHKCLKKAKELGLLDVVKLDDDEQSTFEVLAALYSTKQLEYIVTGEKEFPITGSLYSASRKLLDGICPLVGFDR
jgi:hypothetical protein